MPISGEPCPEANCNGVLFIYSSKPQGDVQVRYVRCNTCGKCPENNREAIPRRYAVRKRIRMRRLI